jgi:archaellum biogenesis protein FlaJ (TadC family)
MEAATAAVESTSAPLPTFGSPELGLLNTATMGMVIALAVINALAIVATDGGHTVKTALYLGILLIVSGLCFVFVPPMVANIVQI